MVKNRLRAVVVESGGDDVRGPSPQSSGHRPTAAPANDFPLPRGNRDAGTIAEVAIYGRAGRAEGIPLPVVQGEPEVLGEAEYPRPARTFMSA